MEHSPANPWLIEQNRLWRELAGSTITRWAGLDSNTGGDDELVFLDRGAPFQQLGALRIERADKVALDFSINQNDHVFGLSLAVSEGALPYKSEWNRDSDLTHLVTGKVDHLEAHIDDRSGAWADVIEVRLSIGGEAVLIVAGEVVPTLGEPRYAWADESFLVFADPDAADAVTWADGRTFSSRVISHANGDVYET